MKRRVILLSIIFSLIFPYPAYAVSSYAPANYYPIAGKVKEGSIVTVINGKYAVSIKPYDSLIVGIITGTPAVTQKISGPTPFYPVINSGEDYVLVSTINGSIKKGDYITSSTIPGVGQKATGVGNTIGIAEDNFSATSKYMLKKIPVAINIHYVSTGTNETSNAVLYSNSKQITIAEQVETFLRYVLAVLIVIITFVISLKLINKTTNKGIEALGRNPLASRQIYVGIAFNISVVLVILYIGFTTGSLILRL
jgi:hypothetical protein